MALESVLIISAIDTHESRDVAMVEIPGSLLTTDIDNNFIVLLQGILAELLVNIKPSICQNFVVVFDGRMVLYIEFQKALYGCLSSVLLFYEEMVSVLNLIGFIIKPCNPCVANMVVNGKHTTIKWHNVSVLE